jgi:formylglycine-generating enzyme required for sulfatase activity
VSCEAPQHFVEITKPFYLGVYEVTQAEYEQVVGSNPSQFKDDVRQPVEMVSWFEAVAFCNRLSERERIQPYYKVDGESVSIVGGNGYRLPTEAEWEYACRAGTTTKWSFGDDESMLGDHAWHVGNSGDKVHKVGEKKPNPWGLYDMHGNLWEWCWDKGIARYEAKSVKDPMGLSEQTVGVLRGGAFVYSPSYLRSAERGAAQLGFRHQTNGFRLARCN